jgi:hypothetical protein
MTVGGTERRRIGAVAKAIGVTTKKLGAFLEPLARQQLAAAFPNREQSGPFVPDGIFWDSDISLPYLKHVLAEKGVTLDKDMQRELRREAKNVAADYEKWFEENRTVDVDKSCVEQAVVSLMYRLLDEIVSETFRFGAPGNEDDPEAVKIPPKYGGWGRKSTV